MDFFFLNFSAFLHFPSTVWTGARSRSEAAGGPFFSLPTATFAVLPFAIFVGSPLVTRDRGFESIEDCYGDVFGVD